MLGKFEELKNSAKQYLQKKDINISEFTNDELLKIFHELEVHQIELEMQNDELLKTKNTLEQTKNKYLELFEFAPIGYLVIDKHRTILEANYTFCKFINKEKREVINFPFSDFIASDFQDTFYLNFRQQQTNGKPSNIEIQIIINQQKKTWVKLELNKQNNSNNYFISITNINQQKETETILKQSTTELKQINTDKDIFIKILSHDLRSPFNSILGFSKLLLKNIQKYDIRKIETQIKIINKVAYQAFALLEQILLWEKTKSRKFSLDYSNFDFEKTTNEIIQSFDDQVNQKNIHINCSKTENLMVSADLNLYRTIIRNLISNAIKFTRKNGQINIIAKKNKDNILISVADNGIGIDNDKIHLLWIYSDNYTTPGTNDERGSGFGLTLCKELIEKHGGKIWVESEIDKGSNFNFTIPLK